MHILYIYFALELPELADRTAANADPSIEMMNFALKFTEITDRAAVNADLSHKKINPVLDIKELSDKSAAYADSSLEMIPVLSVLDKPSASNSGTPPQQTNCRPPAVM